MQPSQHRIVCYGEVLWDILPSGPLPGGAPMNVAYHLKKLGINPAMITRIGADPYGEELVRIFSESGVSTDYFQLDYEHPTGLVQANVTNLHEVQYNIIYPSAWDFIEANEEVKELVSNAEYFVFGSLSSRGKVSRYSTYELLDIAKTKVLDINLRPPHYSLASIEYLLQQADILKMNEAELSLISSWLGKVDGANDQMKLIQDRFNIKTMVVTLGGDGAIVLDQGLFYRHYGFKVQVADTIGSGDSFLAGFLYKLIKHGIINDALEFASAVGAFVATRSGGCPEYNINEVHNLINPISSLKTHIE